MPKILVVEADQGANNLLSSALSLVGDVTSAFSVTEANPQVSRNDIVITNYHLTDGKGSDIIMEAVTYGVPYFLTSGDGFDMIDQNPDLGAHILCKPFAMSDLQKLVAHRIGNFDKFYTSTLPVVMSYTPETDDQHQAKVVVENAGLARVIPASANDRWTGFVDRIAKTHIPLAAIVSHAKDKGNAQLAENVAQECRVPYILLSEKPVEGYEVNTCAFPPGPDLAQALGEKLAPVEAPL
tara:strand:+ start:1114 stop:1830 length:717 start_codon:yes stop_codon:yes gene_type:complete